MWSNTRLPVPSSAAGGEACSAAVRSRKRRAPGSSRSQATSSGRRSAARFGHFMGYKAKAPRLREYQLLGKTASGAPSLPANSRTRTPALVSAAYSAACSASTAARTLSRASAAVLAMKALSQAACALLSKAFGAIMSTVCELCAAADCASGTASRSSATRKTKPLRAGRMSVASPWQCRQRPRRTAATGTPAAAPPAPSAFACRQRRAPPTRPPSRSERGRAHSAAPQPRRRVPAVVSTLLEASMESQLPRKWSERAPRGAARTQEPREL